MHRPLVRDPARRHHEREPGIGDHHDRRADEVEAEPQAEMHQRMELPPAVVVGVEEEGLGEEEQDVREKGRGEHAHQVVRELRIQDDEHERQERSEGRGEREGDREELRELVREPVVSQISGLVADHLDDEREDAGRQGRTPRTAGGAARPTRSPRGCRRSGTSGTRPPRRACLGLRLRVGLLGGLSLARGASASTVAAGARYGSLYSRLTSDRGHLDGRREHHEAGDGTEKDQQLAVHRAVHHAVRHGASLT